MRKLICCIIVFYVLLMYSYSPEKSFGYKEEKDSGQLQTVGSKLEIEWDYLTPIEKKREIDTLSLNILKEYANESQLSFYRGITITRPWGNIIDSGVILESSAFGIGPVYLMRYEPLQWDHLSLSFDMSGGLIFYKDDFPAGGRFYNFMWRIGPKFSYQIVNNYLLNIGFKLMHVSNGHLSGNKNPAYNAGGVSLSITRLF
jgi:lipid A 3-O-deacylase